MSEMKRIQESAKQENGKATRIIESASVTKEGKNFKALIIKAGQGSSGYYSQEMLEQYGPSAWPVGTQLFYDHLGESERWERNGSHSVRDLVGVLTSTPAWSNEQGGLTADIKIFESHSAFIEEAFPYMGLSVESSSSFIDDDGNVTAIMPHPFNAVSFVTRAGAGGKITEIAEKYKDPATIENDNTKPKGAHVTEEQIKALTEGIATAVISVIKPVVEGLKPEPKPEDETAPDFAAVVESAIEAGLPKSARARIVESVRTGTAPEKAIASEKAIMAEYKSLAESAQEGRLHGATKTDTGATFDELMKGI